MDFHNWLFAIRADYMNYKTQEGPVLTFAEYISARALFIEENK